MNGLGAELLWHWHVVTLSKVGGEEKRREEKRRGSFHNSITMHNRKEVGGEVVRVRVHIEPGISLPPKKKDSNRI